MKKRNFMSITVTSLMYVQSVNAFDVFKHTVLFTALYYTVLESFAPPSLKNLERSLPRTRLFQEPSPGEDFDPYEKFLNDFRNIENLIKTEGNWEGIYSKLDSLLMTAGMQGVLGHEDKMKAAQLFLKINTPEMARELLKEAIDENPLPQNIFWREGAQWISTQLEALNTLASLDKDPVFIKKNLDKIKDMKALTPENQLNIAKLYLKIEHPKKAILILEDLSSLKRGDPIAYKAREILSRILYRDS